MQEKLDASIQGIKTQILEELEEAKNNIAEEFREVLEGKETISDAIHDIGKETLDTIADIKYIVIENNIIPKLVESELVPELDYGSVLPATPIEL